MSSCSFFLQNKSCYSFFCNMGLVTKEIATGAQSNNDRSRPWRLPWRQGRSRVSRTVAGISWVVVPDQIRRWSFLEWPFLARSGKGGFKNGRAWPSPAMARHPSVASDDKECRCSLRWCEGDIGVPIQYQAVGADHGEHGWGNWPCVLSATIILLRTKELQLGPSCEPKLWISTCFGAI